MEDRALTLQKGQLFANEYRIARRLGEGGMGSVYVARQRSTSAPRALKLMHPDLVADETLRRRFEQEAQIGARIRSDHVVKVLAAGVDEETGTPWLAMELLEGETLAAIAKRQAPLDRTYVGEIFLQMCHALGWAHRLGIVHRDLKPENVFVCIAERPGVPFTVKVLDFGIAKVVAEAGASSTEPLGTPLWMSPEQTEHGKAIDPRADVWSLGLIAFYLLTGKHFWRAAYGDTNAMRLLREIAYEPLATARERAEEIGALELLPAGFDEWFAKCVTRDLEARFADAAVAQASLAPLLGTRAVDLGALLPGVLEGDAAPASTAPVRPAEIDETAAPSSNTTPKRSPSRPSIAQLAVGFAAACAFAVLSFVVTRTPAPPPAPARIDSATPVEAPPPPVVTESATVSPPEVLSSAPPPETAEAPSAKALPPKPAAAKPKLDPFNRTYVDMSLHQAVLAASACIDRLDVSSVTGSALFVFRPNGTQKSVHVQGIEIDRNGTAHCIESVFGVVHPPPYDGAEQLYATGFTVLRRKH